MPIVKATMQIHRNPTGKMEMTGDLDEAGNEMVRAVATVIPAGTIFEIEDGEDLRFYRGLQPPAVVDLSEVDLLLYRNAREVVA